MAKTLVLGLGVEAAHLQCKRKLQVFFPFSGRGIVRISFLGAGSGDCLGIYPPETFRLNGLINFESGKCHALL